MITTIWHRADGTIGVIVQRVEDYGTTVSEAAEWGLPTVDAALSYSRGVVAEANISDRVAHMAQYGW